MTEGANKTPPITGASEIVLSVANIEAMRAFYRDVLGFPLHSEFRFETEQPEVGGVPTIVFLTIANTDTPLGRNGHPQLLALIDYKRHVFAKERFDGHSVTRSTLNHLAFEIPPESYDAHWERLTKLDLSPRAAEFPDMQARAMFFKDPEGNALELICHHRGR